MTALEYMTSSLGDLLSPSKIDLMIFRAGIFDEEELTTEELDRIIYEQLPLVVPFTKSISESGISFVYDMEALRLYYSLLAKKLGEEDTLASQISSITDKTELW